MTAIFYTMTPKDKPMSGTLETLTYPNGRPVVLTASQTAFLMENGGVHFGAGEWYQHIRLASKAAVAVSVPATVATPRSATCPACGGPVSVGTICGEC